MLSQIPDGMNRSHSHEPILITQEAFQFLQERLEWCGGNACGLLADNSEHESPHVVLACLQGMN
jgi:hypothetical protein